MAGRLVNLIFACLAIPLARSQDLVSPCPKFFVYEANVTEQDRWHGKVTLLSNTTLDGVWLRLLFNSAPLHVKFQNQFGEINTRDGLNYFVKNVDYELKANTTLILMFYVQDDTRKSVPLLTGVRLNAKTICIEEKIGNQSDTTINRARNETNTVSKGCLLKANSSFDGTFISTNDNCGRPSLTKPESVILDENSLEGRWPWIVAIYRNLFGISSYVCGGSLISHNLIITAAYCLINNLNGDPFSTNKILAYLGTTSIHKHSDGLQVATISRIVIHSKYTQQNLDNNIAILKTRRSLEYSYFVKPVCLWDGDSSLSSFVDKIGHVVSWRHDRDGTLLETVKEFKMAIIDAPRCILTGSEYFGKSVLMNDFCTVPNDFSTYNGSPGSGLVVKQNNVNGEILWYLRGLASNCPLMDKGQCDPDNYVIFVDVAKYIPWIKETIKYIYDM